MLAAPFPSRPRPRTPAVLATTQSFQRFRRQNLSLYKTQTGLPRQLWREWAPDEASRPIVPASFGLLGLPRASRFSTSVVCWNAPGFASISLEFLVLIEPFQGLIRLSARQIFCLRPSLARRPAGLLTVAGEAKVAAGIGRSMVRWYSLWLRFPFLSASFPYVSLRFLSVPFSFFLFPSISSESGLINGLRGMEPEKKLRSIFVCPGRPA